MKQDQTKHGLVTRRHVLVVMGAAGVAAGTGMLSRPAAADAAAVEEAIKSVTGGKQAQEGRITLELPQIAENGNTVPIGLAVDSPMTDGDYVKTVHIFAEGNPQPSVASFHFTPMSGAAKASTRMRLARTQNVVAVAEMSDGSFYRETVEVKVTIGGCGG